jgi:hypothetical protein
VRGGYEAGDGSPWAREGGPGRYAPGLAPCCAVALTWKRAQLISLLPHAASIQDGVDGRPNAGRRRAALLRQPARGARGGGTRAAPRCRQRLHQHHPVQALGQLAPGGCRCAGGPLLTQLHNQPAWGVLWQRRRLRFAGRARNCSLEMQHRHACCSCTLPVSECRPQPCCTPTLGCVGGGTAQEASGTAAITSSSVAAQGRDGQPRRRMCTRFGTLGSIMRWQSCAQAVPAPAAGVGRRAAGAAAIPRSIISC